MGAVDVVVIAGAPGSGKSVLMNQLAEALPGWPPRIEFSDLREWHLDPLWELQGEAEEAIAFENVLFVIENYRRHGFAPVLVTDFREHRVGDLLSRLGEGVVVISLVASDAVIRDRVASRGAGFTDVTAACEWNSRVRASPLLACEQRHDTSTRSVSELVDLILPTIVSPSA